MYPIEISKKLGMHEQKIYYHIRKLIDAGVIKIVKEEEKKGAIAKYYRTLYPAFGIELPFKSRQIKTVTNANISENLRHFFSPIVKKDGNFDGIIVIGSPEPHGPFKTSARDGHYSSYLTFFLGQLARMPEDFIIKLDVDLIVEKEEKNKVLKPARKSASQTSALSPLM